MAEGDPRYAAFRIPGNAVLEITAVDRAYRRDASNARSERPFQQSRGSFLAGLQLYRARPDKGFSLVDCISMQAMRKEGLTEVLTNDRHFEQEGFRALFRDC